MTCDRCDCCGSRSVLYFSFGHVMSCPVCGEFAVVARLPFSAVADFIELCQAIDPGNL